MATVRMIHSVSEHVAGEEYDLPDEIADRYVVLGYAEGDLTREITDDERAELQADTQQVSV